MPKLIAILIMAGLFVVHPVLAGVMAVVVIASTAWLVRYLLHHWTVHTVGPYSARPRPLRLAVI